MITDDGKEIISKYLLGQVPAYATHIAIGCGAIPLATADPVPSGLNVKDSLDFEMIRVPITSRGLVDDGLLTKVSLTAELPTENRYEITEVGLWSAGSNSLAQASDSRHILNFTESWQKHDSTSVSSIPFLDTVGTAGDFGVVATDEVAFVASSSNSAFHTIERKNRNEGPRFLNQSVFMRGDSSTITGASGSWAATGTHIHLNGINFDISQNSPSDELTLALSLIDTQDLGSGVPDSVKVLIQFYKDEVSTTSGYSQIEITINGADFTNDYYKAAKIPLSDMFTSNDFSSKLIRGCRVFVSVIDSGVPSALWYVSLDGLRIDNVTTSNPLYKLTGYSIVRNTNGWPVTKYASTNNYVEFRYSLGVT